MIVVSHAEHCPFDMVRGGRVRGPAVSLCDWRDFQKFLQLRQLRHVAGGRVKAAFKFANAALKFDA
jgi:hypothetical protein